MKTLNAKELRTLLKKKKFIDCTKEDCPWDFENLKINNYNPRKHKLSYSMQGVSIIFTAFDIEITSKYFSYYLTAPINELSLKSLLCYLSLSHYQRNKYLEEGYKAIDLHKKYNSEKECKNKFGDYYDKKIITAFESIEL